MLNRFIDHYTDENVATKYSAGRVNKYGNGYMVAYEMEGAKETFSIGQPVYDKDKNIMGWLGIGLFENLNYSAKVRVPCEYWQICLPTKLVKSLLWKRNLPMQ